MAENKLPTIGTPGAYAGYGYNQPTLMDNTYSNAMSGIGGFAKKALGPIYGGIGSQGSLTGAYQSNPQFQTDGNFDFNLLNDEQRTGYGNAMNLDMANQGPGLMDIGAFGMNAYNMYKNWGFQEEQMDMAREQMGRAKEQWDITKQELGRINKVKNNTDAGYGGYGSSPANENIGNPNQQFA